jgi:site-specific recombinase XerD
MEELKDYLLQKFRPSSLASNLYHIKRYLKYAQDKAHSAQCNDILNYIAHLRKNHNLKPQTLVQSLHGVKIYYQYLIAMGIRKDHPCGQLRLKDKIDRKIQLDNLYSRQELDAFLSEFAAIKSRYNKRNQVIISLLIHQGLTNLEITNLEVENIDLQNATITIKRAYNTRERTLPLQASQILLLYYYLENDRKKLMAPNTQNPNINYLILSKMGQKMHQHSICNTINEHRKGKSKLQPKKIRQSVIVNLLQKENDTRIVQVFVGHSKSSTTEQYKQETFENLQEAVNKYHPLK